MFAYLRLFKFFVHKVIGLYVLTTSELRLYASISYQSALRRKDENSGSFLDHNLSKLECKVISARTITCSLLKVHEVKIPILE